MKAAVDSPIKSLIGSLPQIGRLEWIGVRPERKRPLINLDSVEISEFHGLDGDHFSSSYSKKRQVTLIQKEHLDTVASLLGQDNIDPSQVRRNLVISGINLFALRDQKFEIGKVILQGTGYCHPCSRMEENLGEGGYNAMRGHGGITAQVVRGGLISQGDQVKLFKE